MKTSNRNVLVLGLASGVCMTVVTAVLMRQSGGASTPVKSDPGYFVTGEGDEAHLWVREGTNLRCVGHGECAAHAHDHDHDDHDHKDGDGHDHGTPPAPKKP